MIVRISLPLKMKKYQLYEENKGYYDKDLLKPLFCWMFVISYETLTKNLSVNNA